MKRKIRLISNQNGFAVVYGLAILFAATIAGTSLVYLTGKDKAASSEMIKVRAAAIAARAAIQAVEGQFAEQPDVAFNVMKKFSTNSSYKWLLGNDANASNSEKIIQIKPGDSNSPEFSARIMKFDPTNLLLQIEGIGRGGGIAGGTNKVIAVYTVGGMGMQAVFNKRNAIHITGEARNFDRGIIVTGDVYMGGDVHFNGAGGTVIHGNFKTGATADLTKETKFDGPLTVNGDAYLQTKFYANCNKVRFNGKAGFERNVSIDNADLEIAGDAWFQGDLGGNRSVNMMGFRATYTTSMTLENRIIGESVAHDAGNVNLDIGAQVGMTEVNETAFTVNENVIAPGKIKSVNDVDNWEGKLNSTSIQTAYDNAKTAGQLWNDYLVVRVDAGKEMMNDGGTFTGKVIWIVENQINCNGNWYNASAGSRQLVYVKTGGKIAEFGGNCTFNGYVNVTGTGEVTMHWKAGSSVNGAIQYASETAKFQLNAGDAPLNITFDDNVLGDFANLGVVTDGSITNTIVLKDKKIRPICHGIYY